MSGLSLIDTHCHFDDAAFDKDRPALVSQLTAQGISGVVCPAISYANWPVLKQLQQQYKLGVIHLGYGLHPLFLAQHTDEHLQALRGWLAHEQPIAVGECGLDYFIKDLDQLRQIELFVAQLKYARDFDLPVIIHARRAVDHVLKYVRQIGNTQGVIHSFAGSWQQADNLIKQGFTLGFGGTVTYERAKRLHQVVRQVPDDSFVLETDAPDQPDSLWRGKRNEPARLTVIAKAVAQLRGTSYERIAHITTTNAQRLFRLPSESC